MKVGDKVYYSGEDVYWKAHTAMLTGEIIEMIGDDIAYVAFGDGKWPITFRIKDLTHEDSN